MRLRTLLGLKIRGASSDTRPRIRDRRAWKHADEDDGTRDWPITEFLAEHHHNLYGRPWAVGRRYYDFLLDSGLKPSDTVLDFGCGAGRVGIWLIPYLDAGNYVGMDNHRYALQAFQRYEIPLHSLEARKPTVLFDDSCEPHCLNRTFDVILDFWVTRHFPKTNALKAYRSFERALSENGRVFTNAKPLLGEDVLAGIGLEVVRRESRPNWQQDDDWHVLAKRPSNATEEKP